VRYKEIRAQVSGESSEQIRQWVEQSRELQLSRQGKSNATLSGTETESHCSMSAKNQELIDEISEKMALSLRSME